MRVLFLGYSNSTLIDFLKKEGEEIMVTEEKIDFLFIKENNIQFIVSYGYKHLIKKNILEMLPNKVINLHISYLPYNKGADPNFWSFMEKTPKGVTIHYVDEGLDTGDIIIQKEVQFGKQETLKTSYEKLQYEIQNLFIEHWPYIKSETCKRIKQTGKGSFHKSNEKNRYLHLLTEGFNTSVSVIENFHSGK